VNENLLILGEQLARPGNPIHPGGLLTQYGELRPEVWNAVAEVLLSGYPGKAARLLNVLASRLSPLH